MTSNPLLLWGLVALIVIVLIGVIAWVWAHSRKRQQDSTAQFTAPPVAEPPDPDASESKSSEGQHGRETQGDQGSGQQVVGKAKGKAPTAQGSAAAESEAAAGSSEKEAISGSRGSADQAFAGEAETATPEASGEAAIATDADTGVAEVPAATDATADAEAVDTADAVEVEADAEAARSELEVPESVPSRMQRLRARMARSGGFGHALLSVFSRGNLQASDWEEIEETLLLADVGMEATEEIIENLRTAMKVQGTISSADAKKLLREELIKLVDPGLDRSLNLNPVGEQAQVGATTDVAAPACILVVGVNGTGKTTTIGKLARLLRAEDYSVVLGAADTFRAAASDQLATWGERVSVEVVRSAKEGADPASVAFDAVKRGIDQQVDVVIVDTAGRLQTKNALMDELGKVKRVMEKQTPVDEVLLVLDATTGQNGMRQAEVFGEVAGVTGVVLTKLDGSAKGGIVISVQKELGVPVKLVGLGEGADDLAPFDPEAFVDGLLAD